MNNPCRRVKAKLVSLGMTMADLAEDVAEATGRYMDAPQLSRILNGRVTSPEVVAAVEQSLKIKIGEIPRNPYPKKTPPAAPINEARISSAMLVSGFSRRDLARETGLCYDTICRLVNSDKCPRRESLRKIAEALDVTPEYLLGR